MNEGPGRQDRWQELTKSECFALLARAHLGRVAAVDDRGPVVFPVNFVFDRHTVVLRTDEGTKLDAAVKGSRVAFEIDGADPATRTGWSVLVRGEAVERSPARLSWHACAGCRCARGHRAPRPTTCGSCPQRSPAGGSAPPSGPPGRRGAVTDQPVVPLRDGAARSWEPT
jgi:pyridoxamine 5'-phosphate oxidase-like protein